MTPTPAPAGLPPLPVVAYGYENTRPTEKTALMAVALSNAGDQYPELAVPLVKLSDALAAISAQQVPPGWQLVPVEPTQEMLDNVDEYVGGSCYSCTPWNASDDDCKRVYAAMLASAPQPAQQEGQKHLAACDGGGVNVPKVSVFQYARCSNTLRTLGRSYPRTCAECGLGPCKTGAI